MHHPLAPLIAQAWSRLAPTLSPSDLQNRLSRLRSKNLSRPPRPWCLALRANDSRLQLSSPDSDFCIPHSDFRPSKVTITSPLLHRLNLPIDIPSPGQDAALLAPLLGASPNSLRRARYLGHFQTHHVPLLSNKPGRPIPILYPRRPLHPNNPLRQPHDPLWNTAQIFTHPFHELLPPNFEQQLQRIPAFRPKSSIKNQKLKITSPSFHLPPPNPDYVWYKWKNGIYIGDHHSPKKRRKSPPSKAQGWQSLRSPKSIPLLFHGWRWLCPKCQKPTPTLYLPLPPQPLLTQHSGLSTQDSSTLSPHSAFCIPTSAFPPSLACHKCHRIRNVSLIEKDGWNLLISHLSSGLLFGHEVPRPTQDSALSTQDSARKRPYRPSTSRPSPSRDKVLRRLLNGWPIPKIANSLGISRRRVHQHIHSLCQQERVQDRQALCQKLKSPHAHKQPPHQQRAAEQRREKIKSLLLSGLTRRQIIQQLNLPKHIVHYDCHVIYKVSGVHSREELAAMLWQGLTARDPERARGASIV